jgi:hypothetical protein
MRSYMATHDLIAVSANNRETAINTEQTLDTTMLCALGDTFNLEPRNETNENEATGKEEVDTIYRLGNMATLPFNYEKAQPQHIAFLLAFGLGNCVTTAAGSGYLHTITPIDGMLDAARAVPSFTAAGRYGKTILRRRFASAFVDQATMTFADGNWVKASGQCKATGKYTDNLVLEVVSAAKNAASLSLATLGVQGSTAAERLQNVQQIKVELTTGVWTEVAFSAVSGATPGIITITAPGATADMVNYEILYMPTEAAGWMTFPARVTEMPLMISQMSLTLGGKWTGAAFSGGRAVQGELKSLEYSLNNNLQMRFVPGAGGQYASQVNRDGRVQAIKFNREFRDFIIQQHMIDGDYLGLRILAEGDVYDAPHKYQAEFIFPKLAILSAPISVDGKRLAEAGDFKVLEDDTYGSVIVAVKNLQSHYAYQAP